MKQLSLFDEFRLDDIRREVLQEFTRLPDESYDEWLEVVRIEVDYRIKDYLNTTNRPLYQDFHKLKK